MGFMVLMRTKEIERVTFHESHILVRTILPPHEPNDVSAQTILPHPGPLPLGESELSSDGLQRRTIILGS
jgi:hypothetical protein